MYKTDREGRGEASRRRLIALGLGLVALALTFPSTPALASTISFVSTQHRIYYNADAGESIGVTVSAEGDKNTGDYVFRDDRATIRDADGAGGCSVLDAHTARCSKVGVLVLSVAGQGANDRIKVSLTPSEVPDHPQAPVHTILRGNGGDDSITGSALRDDIFGGDGNDTIDTGGGPDGLVDGGPGIDTLSYTNRPATDNVFVTLRFEFEGTDPFVSNPHANESNGPSPVANTIDKIAGIENIVGGAGNDVLIGDDNDNTLTGGAGDNIMCGGLGNDTVDYSGSPGPVHVTLAGNPAVPTDPRIVTPGDTKARTDCRSVTASGGVLDPRTNPADCLPQSGLTDSGGAQIQHDCVGQDVENIIGSKYDDVLLGNDPDPLLGGGPRVEPSGANHLIGGGGNDILDGGLGPDVLECAPGSNCTVTYASRSEPVTADLSGKADSGSFKDFDPTRTGRGDQLINIRHVIGGAGADTLIGSPDGNNILEGGPGADTLVGGGLGDSLRGGPGNDTLIGSPGGHALLDGGLGDDMLDPGSGGGNTLVGGGGNDTADYSSRTGDLAVYADGVAHSGEAGENDTVMPDVRNILGGEGNDLLVGGPSGGVLAGGPGDDTLVGGPGGHNMLDGGQGNDLLTPGRGGGTNVNGGGGLDTVSYANRTAPVKVTLDGVADSGEAGENDQILPDVRNARGGSANDILIGNAGGGGRLDGGPGADVLDGGLGRGTTLDGGPGDDTLRPGRGGHARLIGGGGSDTVDYGARTKDVFVELNGGHDSGEKGADDSIGTDISRVKTGAGNDTIDAVNGRVDTISCGRGVDTVFADRSDIVAADCEGVARGGVSVSSSSRCTISSASIRMTPRGTVGVLVRCPFKASGNLTLETQRAVRVPRTIAKRRRLVLGSKRFTITHGGRPSTVHVRLSARGRRLVRHEKRVRVRATAAVRLTSSAEKASRRNSTRTLTIKAPRRGSRA